MILSTSTTSQPDEDPDEEEVRQEVNRDIVEADSLAQTGDALEEMQPARDAEQVPETTTPDRREGGIPDATPATRPRRQRFTPGHLKDFVLKRIRVTKDGE